jgi:hypothetical protein
VDLNQVYTAPAIPKLSRRNIKSALITGAIKPQIALNKTKFRFIKPAIGQGLSAENLGPTIKQEVDTDKKFSIIESFLGATNKILVQVQKQLAFDHLSRIAAEKAQLEKDKKRISRKKVSDKEKKLEEPKKNIAERIFDRVTAPIKSIFQKLLDFFSLILTGLILNNAFIWLSKKENQEKLKKFFNFIVDHWKEILIVLGTIKLLGVIRKIVIAAKALKGLIDLFKKKPPGGPPNCGCNTKNPKGPLGGPPDPCAPVLKCIKDNPPDLEAFAGNIASTSKFRTLFDLLPFLITLRSNTKTPTPTAPAPSTPATKPVPATKPEPAAVPTASYAGRSSDTFPASYRPLIDRGRQKALLEDRSQSISTPDGGRINIDRRGKVTRIQTGAEVAEGEKQSKNLLNLFGLTNLPAMFGGVTRGRTTLGTNRPTGTYPGLRPPGGAKSGAAGAANKILRSESIPGKLSRETTLSGKSKGGTIPKFSSGGTVGKGDRPGTDTVPAMVRGGARIMLDAGEEVIKASESMRWRPLLKDINNAAGRMWSQFVEGIKKQESTNTVQAENNNRFAKVLENYDKVLKEEVRRLRKKYNDAMLKTNPNPPPPPPKPPNKPAKPAAAKPAAAKPAAAKPAAAKPAAAKPAETPEAKKRQLQNGGDSSVTPKTTSPSIPTTVASATPETKTSSISLLPWQNKSPNNSSRLFSSNKRNISTTLSRPKKSSVQVINMSETLPPINNQKVGSVPVSGGNPTPLPNISPINLIFAEDMSDWARSLGMG